jgi:hypothetical protein
MPELLSCKQLCTHQTRTARHHSSPGILAIQEGSDVKGVTQSTNRCVPFLHMQAR